MKKLLQIGTVLCGLLITQYGFSQNTAAQQSPSPASAGNQTQFAPNGGYARYSQAYQGNQAYQGFRGGSGGFQGGCSEGGCPADHACEDQPCNDCWCLYAHYEPCYSTTRRCVEEQVPCKKRCCRYCDKYYEVQRCRYVPQYYTETLCRKEPEYYEVDDCKTCYKWVCDTHCQYVPKYYWKHVCKPECNTCQ